MLFNLESESTTQFFLRCQNFTNLCKCLMNEIIKNDSFILTLDEKSFTKFCYMETVDMTAKQTKVLYWVLSNLFILVNFSMDG